MEPTLSTQPESSSLGALFAADELLDTLPWGVLVVDEQCIIRRANQQAARWCGAVPATLLGLPLAGAALPAGAYATLRPLLEPAAAAAREVFLPHLDQWIALSATRRPGGWVLYGHDITPQKQREQQYQALAENTPDVLTRWTPDLRLRYANAAFAARVGQPMSALLGHTFAEMPLAAAVTSPYTAALQRVFATGQPQEYYQPFPTPAGTEQYYVRLVPELRDGEIDTVLGIAHDVTTLRQAEQVAQQSRALLQSVFEAVPLSIVVLEAVRDEQQQIVDFRHLLTNGVADRHMGLELRGRLLRHLLPGYLDAENFHLLVETVETGQPHERTQYYDSFGGPLWLHSRYRKLGEWAVLSHENITARKQAEAETHRLQGELARRAHDHYHALFHAMDEGFCVLEVLFDHSGEQVVDFRYLELNPVFARQSGMPADAQGRTARELLPDLEPFWFDTYGGVARTGKAVRVEHYVPQVDRWFDVYAFRIGAPEARQLAVLFNDITARKQADTLLRHAAEADAFRLRLADALGPLTDPVLIQEAVTRLARLHFGADRCYYCELEGDQAIIRHDASADGLPSVAGTYPLADFALLRAVIEAGQPFVVRNVRQDESVDASLRELCVQLQVISYLNVPVIKNGRPVGVLCLVQSVPREWTAAEVALAAEVAERAWTAVERARAEAALRASEEKYRTLFETIDEGFCLIELLLDGQEVPVDYRFLEVNQVFERQTGLANVAGRLGSELVPGTEAYWLDIYGRIVRTGEPVRFENYHNDTQRWYSVFASRVGGRGDQRICIIFDDITERKRHAANLSLLNEVSADLAQLTDIDATMHALCAKVGAYFGAEACAFSLVDEAAGTVAVPYAWSRAAAGGSGGVYRLAEYYDAAAQQALRAGRPEVVPKVVPDAGADPFAARLAARHPGAYVNLPFVRRGTWLCTCSLTAAAPRNWRPDELELLRELTTRIWERLERARAEEAVRVSAARLQSFVQASSDALYHMTADWGQLLNLEGKDFLTDTTSPSATWLETYVPAADQATMRAAIEAAIAGRHFFELEHRIIRADGTVGWTFSRAVPMLNERGELVEWFGAATDITARKQAEERLRSSEERLLLALQAGRMGSFEWTSEGDRLSLSPMSAQVLGLPPGAAPATSDAVFGLLHPDDRPRHQALFERAGQRGKNFHSIYRIVRPRDGQVRWVEERGQGIRDPATGQTCLRGVHWDVTEQVRTQQQLAHFNAQLEQRVARRTHALQASHDLLQSVFDTNLIAMSVMEAVRDEAGTIQDFRLRLVSRELERETGRTDLVGQLYAQQYPGIREVGLFALAVRTLETGEPQGMEYYYPYEGFHKWYACQFVKLGDGVVATNLDITERKTAEQERTRNLRLLEQAEAVAGLGSWDYDLATGTMRWSDGMYHLFGLPLGQTIQPRIYLDGVVPEDRARAEQLVRRLGTPTGDFEETLRLRVGEEVKTVHIKAVVLPDEAGQPARVLGVDLDISELHRLEADNLRLRLTRQQALFEAVQAAQEAERKRIAEGLHNGIGQILYATKLRLDRLWTPLLDAALIAAHREANQLLGEAIGQTRALSHELVPMTLEEFGLAAALQDVCRKMSSSQLRMRCLVQLDNDAAPLASMLQMALYRMAQELVQNIVKHARGATEASLELETMPGWVLLRAEDNGAGFARAPTENAGLGLRSIRDRVALLGGQLETGVVPTGGAYVRIRIPLPVPSTP